MADEADIPFDHVSETQTSDVGLTMEAQPSADTVDAGKETGNDAKRDNRRETKTEERREEFFYPMKSAPRGIFLIFNHEVFNASYLPTRHGTRVDKNNLADVWRKLGFQVHCFDDLTVKEIELQISIFSKDVQHWKYDCFGCAVLSHGEEGDKIYAKDGCYNVNDELIVPFRDSKSLIGKPKLFFIQACRGLNLDDGHKVQAGCDVTDAVSSDVKEAITIPRESDFLIAYSTVEGYFAWRNKEKGSWFVEHLAERIQNHYNEMDLIQILTLVNRDVSQRQSCTNLTAKNNKKQCPSIVSRLTRFVHFGLEGTPRPLKEKMMQEQTDSPFSTNRAKTVSNEASKLESGYYEIKLATIRKRKELAELEEKMCIMKLEAAYAGRK